MTPKIPAIPIINSLFDGGLADGNINKNNSTRYFLIYLNSELIIR